MIVHSSLFVVRERYSMNYEQKTMNTVFRVNLAETNQVKNTDFLIDLTRIENQFTIPILYSRTCGFHTISNFWHTDRN